MISPVLQVRQLGVQFRVRHGLFRSAARLQAVTNLSFDLGSGETLGVVGESGCGKSTLARAALHLIPVSAGEVLWNGRSLATLTTAQVRTLRAEMQIVFQDPLASLDPRLTILASVAEPLSVFRPQLTRSVRADAVSGMLARVGLAPDIVNRYPHEFSGGQCQRIAIARALILQPKLLVCDEPLSALDVSIQAQIVNLLRQLQRELGLSMLFISHNLAVVRHISQRVLVLYLGRMMELAERDALYAEPLHPYTRALLAAIPEPDPERERRRVPTRLAGEIPSPLDVPSGCVFRTRCPWTIERCSQEVPQPEEAAPGHHVACHRWREIRQAVHS